MADDLQRFLDHQPIQVRCPSTIDRVMKWGRRHKSLVVAGVLLLVITALGLLASTIVIAREHAKTKLAYERVVEQRVAAEQSFLQARQAVDTFTQLGEEELISNALDVSVAAQVPGNILDYYETFLEQHHNDGAVQAELVATRQWVAKIVDELTTLSGYGPLMLLADEHVQEELEIGVAQQARIEGLIEDLWSERAPTVADERLTREGRQHQLAESLRVHADEIAASWAPCTCGGSGKSPCNSKGRSPSSVPRSSRRWP